MCGQYYVINKKNIRINYKPAHIISVLTYQKQYRYQSLQWGFTQNKTRIINARIETIKEKPMFKQALPCIVLANGYYEWDETKIKHDISLNKGILYMAGLYNKQGEFVIVTTQPNKSVAKIHDRMPLILTKQQAQNWLTEFNVEEYVSMSVQDLLVESDVEQLSLNI